MIQVYNIRESLLFSENCLVPYTITFRDITK